MSTFSFGNINVASKKQVLNLRAISDIVQLDAIRPNAPYPFPVVFLADEVYNKSQLQAIRLFLSAGGITSFKIVSALNCEVSKELIKEEQREGLIEFYRNNSSDFWSEIPSDAVIVTVGAALYALTRADHIYPADVMQRMFGRPSFWYSKTQSAEGNWVYPIESFHETFAEGFTAAAVDSFKTRITQMQLKAVRERKSSAPPPIPELKLIFVENAEQFDAFYEANKHRKNELMAWDIETSGFDFLADEVGCVTCSFDGITGYYIRWNVVNKRKLAALLKNNIQLGANLKFDIKFFWARGIPTARVDEDVVVMGHTLDETRSNSLKALAYYYTPFGGYDLELDEYVKAFHITNYLDIPEPLLRKYAAMDAIVTWRVYNAMRKHYEQLDELYPNEKGTKWGLFDYYSKVRIPAVNMYAKIEYRGVYVDKEKLQELRKVVTARITELQKELAAALGVSPLFDFGSNVGLGRLLEKLGWECLGRQKNGVYQCADFQLERWVKDHKEAAIIQEIRSCKVILNTFIGDSAETKGWSQYLTYHPEDGSYRMHPNFNAMGTESGRSKCSAPNMQNVPTHGVFAKEVKQCLTVPNKDDYYMLTLDFSALQMRLASIDSDDEVLCSLFKSGKADIHSKTAYGVFVKGKKYSIEEIEVEQDGKVFKFLGGQKVMTLERGEVFASELTEKDTLA
jgi:DNA polymerase I-like protein with 3'-5' exonuclease and polymerase domains